MSLQAGVPSASHLGLASSAGRNRWRLPYASARPARLSVPGGRCGLGAVEPWPECGSGRAAYSCWQ